MEAAIFKRKKKRAIAGNGAKPTMKPAARVRDYEMHVLVCASGDCKKRGAKDTKKAIKAELRSEGLLGQTRMDTVDCLGLCKHGPNVVVYDGSNPKGTWYLGLDEKRVPKIVHQHLKNGEPVEELAAEFRLRKKTKK